jgi:hypothetical protein
MAISRRTRCAISIPRHPNAIRSPLGNAEMEACAHAHAFREAKSAAAHNQAFQNFILFEQFQIALPLDWIGIILRASWHRPGGCQPIPKSELPP